MLLCLQWDGHNTRIDSTIRSTGSPRNVKNKAGSRMLPAHSTAKTTCEEQLLSLPQTSRPTGPKARKKPRVDASQGAENTSRAQSTRRRRHSYIQRHYSIPHRLHHGLHHAAPGTSDSSSSAPVDADADADADTAALHLMDEYWDEAWDWDYSETEWWGWAVLAATWVVFVVGTGSCLGVWSWAWDVGKTPYAPPELENDPTLPIVGYYPALIVLNGVMAWLWVLVSWVGMKYFRHAKGGGD